MGYHGEFESEDERALVHIPMAMRYRLDQSGIKLTLKQWQGLPIALRHRAFKLPCDTAAAIDAFQRELAVLVKEILGENVTRFEVVRPLAWQRAGAPDELNRALRELHFDPIPNESWQQFSDFQRYVLVALARPGRVSSRLPTALREFCDSKGREYRPSMDSEARAGI